MLDLEHVLGWEEDGEAYWQYLMRLAASGVSCSTIVGGGGIVGSTIFGGGTAGEVV